MGQGEDKEGTFTTNHQAFGKGSNYTCDSVNIPNWDGASELANGSTSTMEEILAMEDQSETTNEEVLGEGSNGTSDCVSIPNCDGAIDPTNGSRSLMEEGLANEDQSETMVDTAMRASQLSRKCE